jgi:uncharacterized membrane protein YuzA (DUF378 family)
LDKLGTGGQDVKKLDLAALALVIVGGLNWGLVGIAKFDLVAAVCGGLDFGETNAASRVVYTLVGVAAVVVAVRLPAIARSRESRGALAHAH